MENRKTLPADGYVTVSWAREYFSVSNTTIYCWIAEGRLTAPIKVGKRAVRFRVEDLRDFEAMLKQEACHVAN